MIRQLNKNLLSKFLSKGGCGKQIANALHRFVLNHMTGEHFEVLSTRNNPEN